MKTRNENELKFARLLPFAILLFFNPIVRMVDILPDFVGCFIISGYLRYPAFRIPFLEEARSGFLKLGALSLLRLPAAFLLNRVRASNAENFDIIVLFTFSFCVIECILYIGTVRNLFAGLFYLGERSECSALISPFSISKKRFIAYTPEKLQALTVVTGIIRLGLNTFPEFLLLTRSVDTGAHVKIIKWHALYPYAILLAVLVVFVMGLDWYKKFRAYISAIQKEGKFKESCDCIINSDEISSLQSKIKLANIKRGVSYFVIGTLFSFCLRVDNISEINLVPYFALPILMLIGYSELSKLYKSSISTLISGIVLCATTLIYQVIESTFLDKYGYSALVSNTLAKSKYPAVIISAFIAFISLTVFLVLFSRFIGGFCRVNTLYKRNGSESVIGKRIVIFCTAGILQGAMKLCDVTFSYYPDLTIVAVGENFSNVVSGLVPWFGIVTFATSIIFLISAVALTSAIKDDAALLQMGE